MSAGPLGSICLNGGGPPGEGMPDSEINVEISFSEQALLYKEGPEGTEARAQSDVDDKLPVSGIKH